jgi:iron complex transport system substrate-binding protein
MTIGLHLMQAGSLDLMRSDQDYGVAASETGDASYPRTATDAHGYRITITRQANRIASLDWTIDEFVYALSPPDRVVVVSENAYSRSFSNTWEFTEKYRPAVGGSAEAVLKADPDLVLGTSEQSSDFTDLLRGAGVPVFRMFVLFTKLDEVAQNLRLTGRLLGRDAEAESALQEFNAAVQRARTRRPPGTVAPRILGYAGQYSYGANTLFNDIVVTLGGVNVGAENGLLQYDTISSEQVLRWNPDWIVTGAGPGEAANVLRKALDDPAIRATAAAQRGQILVLENHVFLPISPFSTLILEALGDALYGAANPPVDQGTRQ